VTGGTVAEAVGRAVVALGGHEVLTLLGSGNYAVTAALREAGARVTTLRHEGAVLTAADAVARVSGGFAVATLHQGPGLTNAVTGLAEAVKSRTPLLVLAADTAGAAVRSNFRLDQASVAASVGAGVERLHGPASALEDTARAVHRALTERRPFVLMMPLDVQAAVLPEPALPAPRALPGPVRPDPAAVAAAAELLAEAQRPVLLAGRGAAGSADLLEELAAATGALLATTAVAGGMFAGSPFDLGISGGFASPRSAELLASADLVLALGASLTMWTTRHGRLIGPGARVVQVDVDPAALGANQPVALGVLGDVGATARDLLEELRRREHRPAAREPVTGASWRDEPFQDASGDGLVDPRALCRALDELLPERTLVVDSGHAMGWAPMHLRLPRDGGFVFTQGFQSVGLGLATAVGAALARPDRLVAVFLGDGGALMSLGELETVARLGLRMAVVVLDDAAYGAEVHHFGADDPAVDLVRFPETGFAGVAAALGFDAWTVRSVGDLEPLRAWSGDRPVLLDAKVVPDVVADWLAEAFHGH
jgi:thiamine pyrophosphate-dependent acetolactate synthase large subunit-like protein